MKSKPNSNGIYSRMAKGWEISFLVLGKTSERLLKKCNNKFRILYRVLRGAAPVLICAID
jgi:hypothetical protein